MSRQTFAYAAVGVLALGIGGYAFLKNGDERETLVVSRAPYVQEISVSGKVVAAESVNLGFSQGGRVSRIYVKTGDAAAQGRVLAELENGDLRAAVLQKEAALEREEAKLDSLKAGTRAEELAVAEADVTGDREALLNEIRKSYTSADDAVRNQLDKFISNPRTASPQLTFTASDSQAVTDVQNGRLAVEQTIVEWKASHSTLSVSSDLAAAAAAAQAALATVYELLSDASAVLSKANTNQAVTAAVLAGYVTDIKNARESVNSAIAALSTATAALDASTKALAVKRAGSTSADIAAQAAQVKAAVADVANARAALGKTLITAPFSGTVSNVEVKAGETALANSPVLSLIGRGSFGIETYVPEVSIASVKTGDTAKVFLEAYGQSVKFEARVVSIDPAETVRDGISTYKTMLQFSAPDPRIRSGMTANTVIETSRTEDAIVVPRGAIYEADGKRYVQVVSNGSVVSREIEVASGGSLGRAEVTAGLSEGEAILLTPEF